MGELKMNEWELRAHAASFGENQPLYRPFEGQKYWGFAENAMFEALLSRIRPEVSLEVGTLLGLRMNVISKYSESAYSIDLNPEVAKELGDNWENVSYVSGDSGIELPKLLKKFGEKNVPLEFAFIDGDHSREAVRKDVEALLAYKPSRRLYVLFHDSFNPECRQGMLDADWRGCPYCKYVEMDYVQGVLHPDSGIENTMWGGLAMAIFEPEERVGELVVKETLQGMFRACQAKSVYNNER